MCLDVDMTASSALFYALLRERWEGTSLGPPFAHRGDECKPRLLGEVLALTPGWKLDPPHRVLNERLVAANEFVLGAPVASLRCVDKPPGGRVVLGREAARWCHGGAW